LVGHGRDSIPLLRSSPRDREIGGILARDLTYLSRRCLFFVDLLLNLFFPRKMSQNKIERSSTVQEVPGMPSGESVCQRCRRMGKECRWQQGQGRRTCDQCRAGRKRCRVVEVVVVVGRSEPSDWGRDPAAGVADVRNGDRA